LALQVIPFDAEAVAFVPESVAAALGVGARDGLEDVGRIPVQGLPRSAG
jgi:hypothetical protein